MLVQSNTLESGEFIFVKQCTLRLPCPPLSSLFVSVPSSIFCHFPAPLHSQFSSTSWRNPEQFWFVLVYILSALPPCPETFDWSTLGNVWSTFITAHKFDAIGLMAVNNLPGVLTGTKVGPKQNIFNFVMPDNEGYQPLLQTLIKCTSLFMVPVVIKASETLPSLSIACQIKYFGKNQAFSWNFSPGGTCLGYTLFRNDLPVTSTGSTET